MSGDERRCARRGVIVDVLALGLLAALLYLPGLARHGVTNWQEAQRLIVARDMQARWHAGKGIAALVVPTVRGVPYLAKPPMVYWAELLLAEPFGAKVELWHLRLAVALAGIAGVLATYACARVLFPGPRSRTLARWAGLLLATGLLSTRSARIGELDVFLMPLCTMAITCIALAWRSHREGRGTRWPAVFGGAVFTLLAVLVKDPAVMVVGFGGFAAIAVYYASAGTGRERSRAPIRAGAACVSAAAAMAFAARTVSGPVDVLGAAMSGAGVGLLVYVVIPLASVARLKLLFGALARTHPIIVLGVPVAARFGWAAWVDRLVGKATSGGLAKVEAEDNLRLFVAEAPINNLQAAMYGVGLGSIAAIVVLVWIVRKRPRLTPSGAHLAAWIGLGLLAFSVLGKGVPRYLTPMWPAIAIVGAWGVRELIERARADLKMPWLKAGLVASLLLLGVAQTAWYGYGREALEHERSPKAMMAALRSRTLKPERRRVFSYEFTTPAMDYYLGRHVRPLGDARVNPTMAGGVTWPVSRLKRFLSKPATPERTAIVLVRAEGGRGVDGVDPVPAVERLRAAGLVMEKLELPAEARFEIDRGRSVVEAWRVRAKK